MHRSTFLPLQEADPTPSFGGFGLKEAGIDKVRVVEILEGFGLGLPGYYEWRTRSGCTFCFLQQKIEWVRLKERHLEYFEEAKGYEKMCWTTDHRSPFAWSHGESLVQLERPERMEKIQEEHVRRLARARDKQISKPLRPGAEPLDIDDFYGSAKVCLACHK